MHHAVLCLVGEGSWLGNRPGTSNNSQFSRSIFKASAPKIQRDNRAVVQEDQDRAQQEERGLLDELRRDEQRLRASRDDIDGKMRALGALGDTVGELRGASLGALKKKLVAASREIEKTGSTVNQKAVEEFGDFVEEQKRLTTRGEVRTPRHAAFIACVRTDSGP